MKQERNLLQRMGIFLFTICLVIGALWVTLNRDMINFDNFHRWRRYGELSLTEQGESEHFSHGGGESASFALADQGAVMVSQSGSRYYSLTGDIYAERVVNYKNPVLREGKTTSVLYDAGGNTLLVYGEQKELFSLSLGDEGSVLSARLNENDWLVVVTQESGYKGVVTVYNQSYQGVMNISLSTTYVMDAYLSPDNKKIALVTIGQSGGEFQSTLHIYSIGKEEAEAEVPLYNQVVLDLDYEKDTIWLLCEKAVILIDTSKYEKKSWSFSGYYLKNATFGGNGFGTLLLGKYRAGTADRLVTVDSEGELITELALSGSPLSLASAGNYIAYLTGERFVLYNPQLEEYGSLGDVNHANSVAVTSDGTVLLASNQEAWLYVPQK